ncbi:MAG TPA: hypothetical protein VMW13_01165 [Dehalococcoidales bacterium]|nr:hypothetical protein [Dehalococcoidales bacterium]
MSDESPDKAETRQDRRQRKLKKKRERVPKHGRGLAEMYRRVILKRLRGARRREQ